MDRPIDRRDILNGAAAVAGSAALGLEPARAQAQAAQPTSQDQPGYYPPNRMGMRGSHPGSFELAHALRDGALDAGQAADTDETYDLIVVGGGISGLAAAWFWREAHPGARILILENHDDFGGHAKRNEFHVEGRTLLMNGGTLEIDSPRPYSAVSSGLLRRLGIEPAALAKACERKDFYHQLGLQPAVFFDRETFGEDRLIRGLGEYGAAKHDAATLAALLADAPLPPQARADIVMIETAEVDYLPGLSMQEKMDRLSRLSYRDYLLTIVKADPGVVPYYQTRTHGEWGIGIDAEPALDCWGFGLPGFQGLKLDRTATRRMGNTAAGYSSTGGSETFHFPDGNASIARLVVRDLIPGALQGSTAQDIVTARADYSRLDRAGAPVRIRLNSVVVQARNVAHEGESGVELIYMRDGKARGQANRVRASACILAGYNMMIPYIVPDLPTAQKAALHQLVKVPLVYASVALRNWRAFAKLGVSGVTAPGGYFSSFSLNPAEAVGGYAVPGSPDTPTLLRMTRTPCLPGAPTERDQHRAGRAELLATPFSTFERHIRDQLGRTLGAGGFDPARDIAAIAVNRWPHGYAYEYNPLYDPWDLPETERPHVIGRQRFGRIAIANSDSGAAAYTDSAIDQAYRAVQDLTNI